MSDSRVFLYFTTVAVNLVTFGAGSAFSWASPVLPKLKSLNDAENPFGAPISSLEESWIGSLVCLGAVIGPFASCILADRIGRKNTLIIVAIPMIVSYLITGFAANVWLYYLARFMLGFGSGCTFSIVPLYSAEIAENKNRGIIGCLMVVWLTMGTLSSYIVGPYVTIRTLSLFCICPLVIFLIIGYFLLLESPYYLIMAKKVEEAEVALKKLRNSHDVKNELNDIVMSVEKSAKNNRKSFRYIFKSRTSSRGLIVSFGMVVFQQLSAITIILGYMQTIFDETGSSIPPEIASIFIGSIQVIVTFLTSQLVDRLGRRILLLASLSGITVALLTLGGYFHFKNDNFNVNSLFWLPIACLTAYMIFYNLGMGPLTWSIMGELFPMEIKAMASTLTTSLCFLIAFTVTVLFPSFLLIFGPAVSFWIFAACSGFAILFVAFLVPETKGKSLEEIQYLLGGKRI